MVYLEGGVNVLEIVGYWCALVMKSMHFIWIVVYQLRGFGFFFFKLFINHWHPPIMNSALHNSYFLQMMYSDSLVSVQGHQYRVKHIVCSLICWLLPCIPVGVVLGSKTTKYDVVNMRSCFPGGTDTGFFTTTFLNEIAQGVGCTCLILVAYKLFMVRCLL